MCCSGEAVKRMPSQIPPPPLFEFGLESARSEQDKKKQVNAGRFENAQHIPVSVWLCPLKSVRGASGLPEWPRINGCS